jgi:hypothetical protein
LPRTGGYPTPENLVLAGFKQVKRIPGAVSSPSISDCDAGDAGRGPHRQAKAAAWVAAVALALTVLVPPFLPRRSRRRT